MSPGLGGWGGLTVVGGVERGRGGVAGALGDLAMEAVLVELVEVAERGPLDGLEPGPWSLGVDEFPLVEPVDALD